MAECKYKVAVGHRYARNCGLPATHVVTFTSHLDDEYYVICHLPVCTEHKDDKCEHFAELGIEHTVGKL